MLFKNIRQAHLHPRVLPNGKLAKTPRLAYIGEGTLEQYLAENEAQSAARRAARVAELKLRGIIMKD